ncbi:MAG: hypothetical protein IPM23_18310 [Candidatus Melainabacteria bacterium]|nr:hypothetical protein [Candidatus Melainabacteria bacterium]
MKLTLQHSKYVGGPLAGRDISPPDWNSKHYLISMPEGTDTKHFYSLRSLKYAGLPPEFTGIDRVSAIYYLGEFKHDEPKGQRILPYYMHSMNEREEGWPLIDNVSHYLNKHHPRLIVIVSFFLDWPKLEISQAFHQSSSRDSIEAFIKFASTLRFDEDHEEYL